MSASSASRIVDRSAPRMRSPDAPGRTWAQVAAQVSQQPLTSTIPPKPACQIRKTNGTVRLAQKSKGQKVAIPRAFAPGGRAAPDFTCSPLSSPSESRQSSVSSTATIVLPLGASRHKKYTYTQANGEQPQQSTRVKGSQTEGTTCTVKRPPELDTSATKTATADSSRLRNDNPFWALRNASPRLSCSGSSASSKRSRVSTASAVSVRAVKNASTVPLTVTEARQEDFLRASRLSDSLNGSHESPSAAETGIGSKGDKMASFRGPRSSRDRPRPVVLNDEEKSQLQGYERAVLPPGDPCLRDSQTDSYSDVWTRCRNSWNDMEFAQSMTIVEEKNKSRTQQLVQMIQDGQQGAPAIGSKHYKGDSDDAVAPVTDGSDIDVPVSVFNALATPSPAHSSSTRNETLAPVGERTGLPNPLKSLLGERQGAVNDANPLWTHDIWASAQRNDGGKDCWWKNQDDTLAQAESEQRLDTRLDQQGQPSIMNMKDLFDRYRGRASTNVMQSSGKREVSPCRSPLGQQRGVAPPYAAIKVPLPASQHAQAPSTLPSQDVKHTSEPCSKSEPSASIPIGWKKPTVIPYGSLLEQGFASDCDDHFRRVCRPEMSCTAGYSPFLNPAAPVFTPTDWQALNKRMRPYRNSCVNSSIQPPHFPAMQQQQAQPQPMPPRTPQLRPISPPYKPQFDVELLPSPYQAPRYGGISSRLQNLTLLSSSSPSAASSYSSVPSSPSNVRQVNEWSASPRVVPDYVGVQAQNPEQQHHHSQQHHQQQPRQYSLSPHRKYAYAHPSVYEVSAAVIPMDTAMGNACDSGEAQREATLTEQHGADMNEGLVASTFPVATNNGGGPIEQADYERLSISGSNKRSGDTAQKTSHLDYLDHNGSRRGASGAEWEETPE